MFHRFKSRHLLMSSLRRMCSICDFLNLNVPYLCVMQRGLLVLFTLLSFQCFAQIRINEICASNYKSFWVNEESPDWIELENPSLNPINLEGFYVSDNGNDPLMYALPDTLIPAGEHYVIFCAGGDTNGIASAPFELGSDGETIYLSSPQGELLEYVEFPHLQTDHSYGLQNGAWRFFDSPSPNAPNVGPSFSAFAIPPVLSLEPGSYQGSQTVMATTAEGQSVVLGYNGNTPTIPYTGPLTIDSTTVIEFRSVMDQGLPSEQVGGMYLIDSPHDLPVISLSTPEENLFDDEIGIYVMGNDADTTWPYFGANFWEDWDRVAHLTMIEEDEVVANQLVEIQIHGGKAARTQEQKPFRITARNALGDGMLDHQFMKNKDINSFKKLVLRNSGGDWNRLHFRDAFLHDLMLSEELNIDLNGSEPAVVYLNGEYWGVLNIREKIGSSYIHENYHIPLDQGLTILEEDSFTVEGTRDSFDEMMFWINQTDFTIQENYDSLATLVDIESFAEYIIAETYWNNTDWPANNIKYWSQAPDKKWRFILFDLDVSLNTFGWVTPETDNLGRILNDFQWVSAVQILTALLEYPEFKRHFVNRYADLMNTSFEKEFVKERLYNYLEVVEPEMHRHFGKWGNSVFWWNIWDIEQLTISFIDDRPENARNYLNQAMELEGGYNLKLDALPPRGGSFDLNTIQVNSGFEGIYFKGNAIDLIAKANPGYSFSHWEVLEGDDVADSQTIQQDFSGNQHLRAVFMPIAEAKDPLVYPNPSAENFTLRWFAENDETTILEIIDLQGRLVRTWEVSTIAGYNETTIDALQEAGMYVLSVRQKNTGAVQVVLRQE